MLTKSEKREWILKNCLYEKLKVIDLSGLDLSGYYVITSNMKADEIEQSNQVANSIQQSMHKANYVGQSCHKAKEIVQGSHKAECIYQGGHEADIIVQHGHNARSIDQEFSYAKELRTTNLKNYEKKKDDLNRVYYVLKEK